MTYLPHYSGRTIRPFDPACDLLSAACARGDIRSFSTVSLSERRYRIISNDYDEIPMTYNEVMAAYGGDHE